MQDPPSPRHERCCELAARLAQPPGVCCQVAAPPARPRDAPCSAAPPPGRAPGGFRDLAAPIGRPPARPHAFAAPSGRARARLRNVATPTVREISRFRTPAGLFEPRRSLPRTSAARSATAPASPRDFVALASALPARVRALEIHPCASPRWASRRVDMAQHHLGAHSHQSPRSQRAASRSTSPLARLHDVTHVTSMPHVRGSALNVVAARHDDALFGRRSLVEVAWGSHLSRPSPAEGSRGAPGIRSSAASTRGADGGRDRLRVASFDLGGARGAVDYISR